MALEIIGPLSHDHFFFIEAVFWKPLLPLPRSRFRKNVDALHVAIPLTNLEAADTASAFKTLLLRFDISLMIFMSFMFGSAGM